MTVGIGFLEALTLLFIVLKLTGIIAWSWWLVLLPAIIGIGLTLVAFVVVLLVWLLTG